MSAAPWKSGWFDRAAPARRDLWRAVEAQHRVATMRLVDTLAFLQPITRAVFARVKLERRAIAALTGCGLAGASLEAADLPDPEDEKALIRTRLALGAVGPRMLIHTLRTMAAINAARAAGITYASLDITGFGGSVA